MNITEELERLAALHKNGVLNEDEFAQAKQKLLNQPAATEREAENNNTLGEAANRYVSLQTAMSVIGLIIFLIVLFGVILPRFAESTGPRYQITLPPGR